MKKRILALSLSAALLLALLCACGDPGAQNSSNPSNNPTNNPTQSVQPSTDPTPETPVDLSTFIDKLGGAYELPMVMPMDDEEFVLQRFPGLDGLELPQCYYYIPMMTGVSTAEFVLIQAGKASDIDTVKSALQARIDEQNSPGVMLYPHEQEDWANNARIVTNGSYVLMVVNENCDSIVADFNAFIANPSYVPAPKPESRDNEPIDDPAESPTSSAGVPGFGGVVMPGFGGIGGIGGVGGGNTDPSTGSAEEAPVAPTGRTESDVDLAAFYKSIEDQLPSMMELDDDFLTGQIPGFVSIPSVQRMVYLAAVGTMPSEIALIQVSGSDDVETAKTVLNAHIQAKIAGDAAYNMGRWKDESRIVAHGNYVMMVVSSNCDAIVDAFNALF